MDQKPEFIDYVQATDSGWPPLAACGVGKACTQASANNRETYMVNGTVGCGGFLHAHYVLSRQGM